MSLFPGEQVVWGAGFPALALFRPGDATKPLVLLLPGGGHLARIYYGHPGSNPDDFLLNHLSRSGFSTLALSYPSAHASLNHPVPEMTISQWAATIAAITGAYLDETRRARNVIVAGWSLAGRLARTLALACRAHGIELELFVGLSAAPPIPGFGVLQQSDLRLAPTGLLDASSQDSPIFRSREAHLKMTDEINGRVILPREIYATHYVTDSPINFRGEEQRYQDHALANDLPAAILDQGTFDYASYPLCATISASSPLDMIHALTDVSAFGMLNAQSVYHRCIKPALAQRAADSEQWLALRRLMQTLSMRLNRSVEGSHLFFLGSFGATATARYLQDLALEAIAFRDELTSLLGATRSTR